MGQVEALAAPLQISWRCWEKPVLGPAPDCGEDLDEFLTPLSSGPPSGCHHELESDARWGASLSLSSADLYNKEAFLKKALRPPPQNKLINICEDCLVFPFIVGINSACVLPPETGVITRTVQTRPNGLNQAAATSSQLNC